MKPLKSFYCGFLFVLIGGCTMNPSQADYLKTTKQGIKTVPHVEEIRQLFPDAPKIHFIEQLGLQIGKTTRKPAHWNTEVWFGGRYELTYQVLVVPDYGKHLIKKSEQPMFFLNEVTETLENGRGASFSWGKSFSEEEWNKVVAAKGDFSAIGIHLKTNAPIAGIKKYIAASRENTWAIKEK